MAVAVALLIVGHHDGRRGPALVADAPGQVISLPTRQVGLLMGADRRTNRVVVYVHGAGETAQTALDDPEKATIYRTLLTHGYSIATDTAGGENWGDPASVSDYLDLIQVLRARGLTRIYILAQSMGGLDGIELLSYVRPVAWAGIYPACNLRSLDAATASDNAGQVQASTFPPEIQAAYGADLPHALDSESPLRMPTNVRGLRMTFWASPGDTVVPKRENTDLCAAEADRRGARVTVVSTQGNHGDPSNFQAQALLSEFQSG